MLALLSSRGFAAGIGALLFLTSQGARSQSPADAPPPRVIVEQHGNVTNATVEGQLAAKHPLACVPLDQVGNGRTPPDLYLGVSACIRQDNYPVAVDLFALAGAEGSFDAQRVLDKTAGQAKQVLIMTTMGGLPAEKRANFQAALKAKAADLQAMTRTCATIRKIGYPTYYPEYMVLHGIRAFSAKPGDPTLEANFDSAKNWNLVMANYLNCAEPGLNNVPVPSPK